MTSQQQNPFPPNSQGYAQLSEEDDPNSASLPQNRQEYPNNIPQGTPVIVQGIPAMSYPSYVTAAPMSNFEIYNPAPSQLQKLNSCPYVCYKYWIAINIIFNVLVFVSAFVGHHDFVSHIRGMKLFYYILLGWQIFQLGHIFIGMRDKNLEKVRKGVYMMKIYVILLGIFYLILMFDAYEELYEQVARQREHGTPGEQRGKGGQTVGDEDIYRIQNIIAVIIGVIIAIAGIMGGWFLLYLLPAMKVRDILKTAPSAQTNNSGPQASV